MRFLWPLAIFLGLAGALALGLQRDPRALPSVLIDRPAPAIDLPLLDAPPGSTEPRLHVESLRGRVWLLNVWASWCEPCRQELPTLRAVATRDGVALYGLNYKDDVPAARALLQGYGNPYLGSAVDSEGRVGMDYGVRGVPETFVIDAAGRVRFHHLGPVTEEVWRERLLPVVKALR